MKQFEATLGRPDGELFMSGNRRGLFYGSHLLLIFQAENLREIHAWESNPNIDFWQYVDGNSGFKGMRLAFRGWSPWGLTRRAMKKHDAEFPVNDADERVENRSVGRELMTIYYGCYSEKAQCSSDWASMEVTHVSITNRASDARQSPPADVTAFGTSPIRQGRN